MNTGKGPLAALEDVSDDDGQHYADQINAPLSQETLEALRAELESEEYARYRGLKRSGPKAEQQ